MAAWETELERIRGIADEGDRSRELRSFISRMADAGNPDALRAALDIAQAIERDSWRAYALLAVAQAGLFSAC